MTLKRSRIVRGKKYDLFSTYSTNSGLPWAVYHRDKYTDVRE